MTEKLIQDDEYATLWVDPENKMVHHEMKQWLHGDSFRALLDKGYQQLCEHHCTKWLSDDRKNTVLPPEDQEWANNDWSPRVLKAGWKHWAIVLPEKVIGQMNMKRYKREYAERGMNVEVFHDPKQAKQWLLEQ